MALDGSRPLPPCSIRRRREETPSKHKLARGLFKMADLKPSMQCKPNPTKSTSVIRSFHVVLQLDNHYYVQADEIHLSGKEPQFDVCLYVGTLTLSLRALKVLMAIIADKNYLLLQSDCLEYCKQFVFIYFDLIEEEVREQQIAVLEKLTVTTNALSAASERS